MPKLSAPQLAPAGLASAGLACCILACSILACSVAGVSAHPVRHRLRHVARAVPPSLDAVELDSLAPPTRRSTALQTYGDAAYARARFQRRYPAETRADAAEAASVGVPYPCDPRAAGPDAYSCRNDPRTIGYGQGYAFTPSYVSSPQVVDVDPSAQAPVLPGVTGAAWAINSMRFDPH